MATASKVLNVDAGLGMDIGHVGYGEKDPKEVIVSISLEDEDEIMFSFDNTCLCVPADRIRSLLKGTR